MNALLSTVGALPLHAIITAEDEKILIKGVPLEGEFAVKVRESASALLHNAAFQAVREQVLYMAVSQGIHQSLNFDQTYFAKAAIWFGEQEIKLLQALAKEGNQELSL